YTHYSLLRTIEGALGLGTLTRNDRYAQPVNDVFSHGPAAAPASASTATASTAADPGPAGGATAPGAGLTAAARRRTVTAGRGPGAGRRAAARPLPAHRRATAFVVNSGGTFTPIGLTPRRAGTPIKVGANPQAIAITPGGRTAFVANYGSDTVTPIRTVSR